jgi:hypothetical protein
MRTGFEPKSTPVYEPARRKMHVSLPGIAPSLKVAGGYVRTRMPLMLDAMVHLETNASVNRICPYPIRIEYGSPDETGMFKMRDHIFDLGVELRSGRRLYVDYEPLAIQMERPWMKRRTKRLQEVTRHELDADYLLQDERDIYIQPRFANLKIMYQHLRVKDHDALMAVRVVTTQMSLPTTIAAIRLQVKLKGLRFEIADLSDQPGIYHGNLDDVDRVFTAIMQMAAAGEIGIDLAHPFTDASMIYELKSEG